MGGHVPPKKTFATLAPNCNISAGMNSVTITINDLFEFEGQPAPAQRPDNAVIDAMVRRQFEFLRQPLQVEIDGNTVTVSFSEESLNAQDEAGRLAERAAKRAAEGNYDKAISLWKRVLELNPSHHKARRDLAMSCMETGDIEGAKNHLIEVLRLNPGDAWGWVVLGNLYAKDPKDLGNRRQFPAPCPGDRAERLLGAERSGRHRCPTWPN